MADIAEVRPDAGPEVDQKLKEAYFTASQSQLVWARFRRIRSAMVAAYILIFLITCGLFAPFLSPYDPTIAGRNKEYLNGAPQIPKFCDENGCSWRPFIYTYERTRSIKTNFRWVTEVNRDKRRYVTLLPKGSEYRLLRIPFLSFDRHLFGVDQGKIHIFGTDAAGKDIFSRTLHAIVSG